MDEVLINRFLSRIQKTENCWLWTGDISFCYGGSKEPAPRYSYRLHFGSLPGDQFVHHTCENKRCVNPKHLYTSAKNSEKHTYNYNLDVFYREDEISYYLLGAYMTDGNISSRKDSPNTKNVRICSRDEDWMYAIRNLVCPDIKMHQRSGSIEFGIYSTELADWFISKGCTPRKSLTSQFPTIPKTYLPDFIRGCIDGDGNICLRETQGVYAYSTCLVSGSKEFMTGFNHLLESRNLTFCFKEKQNSQPHIMSNGRLFTQKHPYYTTTLYSKSAYEFIKWAYYPNNKLAMPRKQEIANKLICTYEKYRCRKISSLPH